jgi:hypothetical protein
MAEGDTTTQDQREPGRPWAANLLGLDYEKEAARLGPPPVPIIDVHSHINGAKAAEIYGRVRELYGVAKTYSMTQIDQAAAVRRVLGESVQFIAIPTYMHEDRRWAMTEGFLENIRRFHGDFGAKIVKFWVAPRERDLMEEAGGEPGQVVGLDSAWKIKAAELAASLGMMFMVHVADPDTWFATKYADAARYGTKRAQYEPLSRMLERFSGATGDGGRGGWIAAHMGGWPEDLEFLSGLLERHPNLRLDTSATKWMVRELSRQPRQQIVDFLTRWRGRVLFGSDIVTTDEHVKPDAESSRFGKGSQSEREAFELYASRYWALRTLWETDYDGPSPIADPDLAMVEPDKYDALSSPRLRGKSVPADLLRSLYSEAAERVVG